MVNDKYDIYIAIPLALIFCLISCSMGKYPAALENAKEAEVKHNIHTIQVAVEQYAVYNYGNYPPYLLGGDKDGWDPESERCCHAALQTRNPLPTDPLLKGGFLSSYPRNPFIVPGKGIYTTITWTGGSPKLGYGDPRFGYDGEIMGNCLNDPLNLWSKFARTTNFENTIGSNIGAVNNFISMINMQTPGNPFYSMGGLPQWSPGSPGKSTGEGWLNSFWPGQFFYRAGGPPKGSGPLDEDTEYYIWDFKPDIFDRYLIGGYGSTQTKGIDCIRLTRKDGQPANNMAGALKETYEPHLDYWWNVRLSTPEVFGGGEKGILPTFPYYDADGEWVYGAPDGYPDGIVILLIPGGTLNEFTERASN